MWCNDLGLFLDLLISLTFQLDETFYYYVLRHFLAPELYVAVPVHSQISVVSKAQRVGLALGDGVRNQKKLINAHSDRFVSKETWHRLPSFVWLASTSVRDTLDIKIS